MARKHLWQGAYAGAVACAAATRFALFSGFVLLAATPARSQLRTGAPAGVGLDFTDRDVAPSPTNYGKPRPPQPTTFRRPTVAPLPPLEAYRTAPASVRNAPGGPPPSYAQIPAPPPRRPRVEEEPFAPLGVDAGGLRLRPFVEVEAGYDSNPNRSKVGQGSTALRMQAGVAAVSEWSRHEFKTSLRGSYDVYKDASEANRPEFEGVANLRIDVLRDTAAEVELRTGLTTQRPGTPGLPGGIVGRPTVLSTGMTAGLTQRFGATQANVAGLVDRRTYEDAALEGGGTAALSRGDYTTYGLRGRVAHEITPGVRPFAEATLDMRRHDDKLDEAGFARDSTGVLAQVGSTFELTRTLTGQASAGYGQRHYDDSRLPMLAGPVVNAALAWSATPLTTLTVRAGTEFAETTLANASGAVSRRAEVEVAHALLRNLTLRATAKFVRADYEGVALQETTWAGGLRAEYSLNRSFVLKGSWAHERLRSTSPGSGYTADVFLLGLRLQR